jgi:hypothetical protein
LVSANGARFSAVGLDLKEEAISEGDVQRTGLEEAPGKWASAEERAEPPDGILTA